MSFGFGLSLLIDRVECVLPGVVGIVGVDGGDVAEVPPVTAVVIGDTVDVPTVRASITLGGGGFLFPMAALAGVRRIAIPDTFTLHISIKNFLFPSRSPQRCRMYHRCR